MNRVDWIQAALNELARIWAQADSALRAAITNATQAIDRRLARDGAQEGESRPGGRRIMFEWPLTVIFRPEADGTTITVLHVHLIRQRGTSP